MSNHSDLLLFRVLKAYGISVTHSTIEQEIKTHPEYPSMQSLSDALDIWQVKHAVMKISLERLCALDVPVIAHLKKGEFIWVSRIAESKALYWNAAGKKGSMSLERFEQEWSGAVLAITDISDAGETDYKTARKRELKKNIFTSLIYSGFVVLFALLMFLSWRNDNSLPLLPKLILFVSNATGCYFSYLLIRQEKRQSDLLSDKFCKVGTFIDCRKVTTSKYANFFGLISWAELGVAYFSSMFVWTAIAPLSVGWAPPLWWFSLLVLPFTLWSLATQAFFIGKWCLFCCSVVFLLWINATVLFACYSRSEVLSITDGAMAVLLFCVCLVAIMGASKTIGSNDRLYAQQRETAKIKFNITTIQSQLAGNEVDKTGEMPYQVRHDDMAFSDVSIKNLGFTFGNPDSSHDIGLYVSASCSHCRNAVRELKRMMEIYPDFNYRLVFAVNSEDFDDTTNIIIRHFIALYKTSNKIAI